MKLCLIDDCLERHYIILTEEQARLWKWLKQHGMIDANEEDPNIVWETI